MNICPVCNTLDTKVGIPIYLNFIYYVYMYKCTCVAGVGQKAAGGHCVRDPPSPESTV